MKKIKWKENLASLTLTQNSTPLTESVLGCNVLLMFKNNIYPLLLFYIQHSIENSMLAKLRINVAQLGLPGSDGILSSLDCGSESYVCYNIT